MAITQGSLVLQAISSQLSKDGRVNWKKTVGELNVQVVPRAWKGAVPPKDEE